jgi:hypothetical protein
MVWTHVFLGIKTASVGCILICVVVGREQAQKVLVRRLLRYGETSRFGSRDLMDGGIKCSSHHAWKSNPACVDA